MLNVGKAMLGLDWGLSLDGVIAHLDVQPIARDGETMAVPLKEISGKLIAEGRFCPSILAPGWTEDDEALHLAFQRGGLAAARVRVHYTFRQLGQRSDTLSDSAMTLMTRGEFHRVLAEVVARYGAPTHVSENPARIGSMHVSAMAMFLGEDSGPVQLFYGHESATVAAEMRWMAPATASGGF